MSSKTILVTAQHTEVDGVYSYDAFRWAEIGGKGSFYHNKKYESPKGGTNRQIIFVIEDDLSWRASSDSVYDFVDSKSCDKPYETPEIASDDVGNDMLEVALAAAFPGKYSERNRDMEHESREAEKERQFNRSGWTDYGNPVG